ncbi:MAG: hypothetical protein FIA95_16810 [Gemmatimonadetes bacterium]|nr:hypothetical protein [Gemmatimonadota bacterium]
MRHLTLIRVTLFVLTLAVWRWTLDETFPPAVDALCIVGTMLLVFPPVWAARRLLDAMPTTERMEWVTTGVHAVLMLLLGVAIIRAIRTAPAWHGVLIPVPPRLGLALVYATFAVALLTVLNLAVCGLGAPFSIALSKRLATDWMYAWTRNPMVLATFVCLVALGVWRQSALFIAWVLVLVAPAWVAFVKVYEERELEIRFGDAYRAYRAATPFLWPRRPRRAGTERG